MKITGLETISLSAPLKNPFLSGKGTLGSGNVGLAFVQIHTDEDVVGIGEASLVAVRLIREFEKLVVGEDPFAVERIWEKLFRARENGKFYPSEILMRAVAGIDTAIWDVIGKALNKPLYRLLGGYRNKVPCYASGGYYRAGYTKEDLAKEAAGYVEMGYKAFKMKVGLLDPEKDVERVKAVRNAVGDDVDIMCDGSTSWDPATAIRFAKMAEKYNIRWYEEPVQWYDQVEGTRMVKEATSIPIASGQGEITKFGCRRWLEGRALDIMQADSRNCGGITELRKIAAMAEAYNIPIAPHHCYVHSNMHLTASAPNGLILEIFPNPERNPLWFEVYMDDPENMIKGGVLTVPEKPGLGIELNEKGIEKYRVKE